MANGKISRTPEVLNRKARHRYFVLHEMEAGIVLQGTEVKAFRDGRAQISESFVRLDRENVPYLFNGHIEEYSHGTDANHESTRMRRLLLHRSEIVRLRQFLDRDKMTAVPLKMYFSHGLIKIRIGICKGKDLHDKRQDLKRAVEMREAQRAIARRH